MHRKEYIGVVFESDEQMHLLHRRYYAQYAALPGMKNVVFNYIGLPALLASTDKWLNDIPLRKWDALVPMVGSVFGIKAMLEQNGDYLTLAGGVCILKEAARQIVEEHK